MSVTIQIPSAESNKNCAKVFMSHFNCHWGAELADRQIVTTWASGHLSCHFRVRLESNSELLSVPWGTKHFTNIIEYKPLSYYLPILQIRKPRLRKVQKVTWGPTTSKLLSLGLKPDLSDYRTQCPSPQRKPILLNTTETNKTYQRVFSLWPWPSKHILFCWFIGQVV